MINRSRRWLPTALLLLAFGLRLAALPDLPPGLTHDEANHGREAIGILDGILLFYFPLNYGSEPLYSYVVAALMGLIGEHLFALRLVNVFAGTLTVAATLTFTRRHFGRATALAATAFLAFNFWPLATSRQALRVGLLPFLILLALIAYSHLLRHAQQKEQAADHPTAITKNKRLFWYTCLFGFAITLTLHNYLAARVLWLTFPAFLGYLLLFAPTRPLIRHLWQPTLAGLLLAGLLVIPMFVYINNHPEVATRLDMLDGPLQALQRGDLRPILKNSTGALFALFVPGQGDSFLAYNIDQRPTLDVLTAICFFLGLTTFWRQRHQPQYGLLAVWLLIGLAPSLITGPTANTTRNMGAQPALYIIAALGFTAAYRQAQTRLTTSNYLTHLPSLTFLFFTLILTLTSYDYFIRWGQNPDVRAAYQHTLVQMLQFQQTQTNYPQATAVSTLYPGPAHNPSITLVYNQSLARNGRWFDARAALLFPSATEPLILLSSTATPLHPLFLTHATPLHQHPLRPTDLDPQFTLYHLDPTTLIPPTPTIDINFNDALILYHANWREPSYPPNSVAELITIWQVVDPGRVGPIVPPINTTDINLFTHILNPDGTIYAQRDHLAAPSWSWQAGDTLIQIHDFWLPPDTPPATYTAVTGLYDRLSLTRLPRLNNTDTTAPLPPLIIRPSNE